MNADATDAAGQYRERAGSFGADRVLPRSVMPFGFGRSTVVHTKNAIVHTIVHRVVHTCLVSVNAVFAAFSYFSASSFTVFFLIDVFMKFSKIGGNRHV
jgi:hypothetical protein